MRALILLLLLLGSTNAFRNNVIVHGFVLCPYIYKPLFYTVRLINFDDWNTSGLGTQPRYNISLAIIDTNVKLCLSIDHNCTPRGTWKSGEEGGCWIQENPPFRNKPIYVQRNITLPK